MTKISILIPTYKPDWYIKRCLESIEEQSLSKDDFKVFIALNGPKENYKSYVQHVLKSCSFNYSFYYLEKAGVSSARNYLIRNSTGPFIVFVDDDDVLSSSYLEELLEASSENTLGVSNVYTFEKSISERKLNYISKSFLSLAAVEKSKFKSRKYFSSPCAKMIHRNIIGLTRFNTKLAIGEDALFMAELSKKVEAVRKTSSEAIYYVYQREGSASRSKVNKLQEIKRIFYLISAYFLMLFKGYNTMFTLTRIAATAKQLTRLIRV